MAPKRKAADAGEAPAAKRAKPAAAKAAAGAAGAAPGGVTPAFVEKAFSVKVLAGGRECVSEGRIDKSQIQIRDMGKSVIFSAACKGSKGEEYSTNATVSLGKLSGCGCACGVGKFKKPCKHSCALLLTVATSAADELSITDVKPKAKNAAQEKADKKAIAEQVKVYRDLPVDKLKDLLRMNRQMVGGTKEELVQRVAEAVVLGSLPKCPVCHGGQLRFDLKSGLYSCRGFFDDDEFKPCAFSGYDVERSKWRSSEESLE